jgi:hypothetical protein
VMTVSGDLASKHAATISGGFASKPAVVFLVEPQNQSGGGFPSLSLKTKWASICQLRLKTDGGRSARDTRRDLAACFTWKQVWLAFLSLA